MATLKVDTKKIISNVKKLDKFLKSKNIQWSLITKMAMGDNIVLEKLLSDNYLKSLHSIGDARLSNLKTIKKISPNIETIYIKPPAIKFAKQVVECADISLNSSSRTIIELNKAAKALGKIHKVIVMIELGELREGVLRDKILSFYEKIFELENIHVIGLGTNLGCMYGIEPTYDKLIQLSLYKMLLELKFEKKIPLVSGGSSIALPIITKKFPKEINHFRIGETAFHGINLQDGSRFRNLAIDAFDFSGEIIELERKENVPDGVISEANVGHAADYDENNIKFTFKAIVDFGSIDAEVSDLTLFDQTVKFVGTTSDMTVFDLGNNRNGYKVGDLLHFKPNYMATARLMNSKYITKTIT
ncbi:MAG: alanine racemase [Bacteroidetes bacterium]|nr:alanine racemase [Bacteroidota bacterium]